MRMYTLYMYPTQAMQVTGLIDETMDFIKPYSDSS